MASNVAEILLPLAGALAGLNPYLGSAIRSGATVSAAMQSSKQRRQREVEEEEQARLQATRNQKMLADLMGILEGIPGEQANALKKMMAGSDPSELSRFMNPVLSLLEPPKPGPAPKPTLEEARAMAAGYQLPENVATQTVTVPAEGGTISSTYRHPTPEKPPAAPKPLAPRVTWSRDPKDPLHPMMIEYDPNNRTTVVSFPNGEPDPSSKLHTNKKKIEAQQAVIDGFQAEVNGLQAEYDLLEKQMRGEQEQLKSLRDTKISSVNLGGGKAQAVQDEADDLEQRLVRSEAMLATKKGKLEAKRAKLLGAMARLEELGGLAAQDAEADSEAAKTMASHGNDPRGKAAGKQGGGSGRKVFRWDNTTNVISRVGEDSNGSTAP